MSVQHLNTEDLDWYLWRASQNLQSERFLALENHLGECELCTETLARSASDELAFHSLAEQCSTRRINTSNSWLLGALAAAILVFVVGVSQASSGSATNVQTRFGELPLDAGPVADGDIDADE